MYNRTDIIAEIISDMVGEITKAPATVQLKMKTCNKCNAVKDESCFGKSSRAKDGLQPNCKDCTRIYKNACHAANRERYNARMKAYNNTIKGKYTDYKKNAKNRGFSFELTQDQFATFWQANCYYCHRPIATIGIDRIDSNLGYVLENCRPCCTICNLMKRDYGEEEWYSNMLQVLQAQGII